MGQWDTKIRFVLEKLIVIVSLSSSLKTEQKNFVYVYKIAVPLSHEHFKPLKILKTLWDSNS